MKEKKIEITTSTILKFFGILIGLLLLWYLKSVIALLFVVLIIISALGPIIDKWEKYKIPRWLGAILIYLIVIAFIFLIAYLIIPPLAHQIVDLANQLPDYIQKIEDSFSFLKDNSAREKVLETLQSNLSNISQNLAKASGGILSTTLAVFGGITSFVIGAVLVFYLLLAKNEITEGILTFIPKKNRAVVQRVGKEIIAKLGAWARGQFVLSVIVGLVSGVALKIIGVPYALILGIVAGLTEFIPTVGPIIGAIPAILIALGVSPIKAIIVVIVYILIQQLESNILVPNVMKKAVGINPAIIIIAILIGAELGGVVGMILAVPVAAIIAIIMREWKEMTIGQ